MNKKFRKLILPASLLIASQAFALGLGGLQIDSSLDEVLSAEIPFIIDSSEEIESIEVSVASFAEYEKVGLDKSYVPTNIKVVVIEKNGQKYVQVSSIGPVSEPIVSLLLVVDWSNGHLLREYTILLDPPLFNNTQTNEYSKPVETNTYVAPQQIESQSQPATQTNRQANRQITASNYTGSSQIVVESGDTLWRIASRYNDGSSPQQMMVAIFNNNPDAFLNDDMNQLRKGAVLTIPDSDQVSMVSNGQAVSEVRSHMQKWSRMQTVDSSTNSNDSSTTDFGIELVPPSDSDSSDSYSSSGTSTSARVNTKTIADLNRAKEQLVSSNLEKSELSSRVSELEKIIEDQKLALSLKDSDLAQLQEMLKEDGETDSTSLDVMSDTMSDTPSDTMTTDDVWDEMQSDSTEMSDVSGSESMDDTNSEMMDDSEMVDEMMHEDSMEDSMDSENSDTVVIENLEQDASDTQPAITQPTKKEPSFLEKIMQYKFEGLIGLGVLLLGLLGFVFFKRKGENDSSDSGGFLDDISSNHSDNDSDADNNGDLDDFNSSLDSNSTELDLTNLEDFDDLEDLELSEVTQQGESLSEEGLEEAPEVVVMNDSGDELNDGLDDDLDDLDELDLDLDFGLDDDIESTYESELSEQTDNDSVNTELEFDLEEDLSEGQEEKDSEDLSLDFELDDLDLDDESSDEFEFDLDVSSEDLDKVTDDPEELDELVFDTGERTIVDAVETIGDEVQEVADVDDDDLPDLEFDMSDDLFDTDDLDLGLDEDSDSDSVEKDDVTELNLETLDEGTLSSEFNLDDSSDVEESDETDEDVDIGLDFDDLASDDAIDTKLDLAKAYFEMGDVDGAQQMVNEIIEEGNDEQKSKAENLKNEIEGS